MGNETPKILASPTIQCTIYYKKSIDLDNVLHVWIVTNVGKTFLKTGSFMRFVFECSSIHEEKLVFMKIRGPKVILPWAATSLDIHLRIILLLRDNWDR